MANTNVLPLQQAEANLRQAYESGDKAALRAAAREYVRSENRRARSVAIAQDTRGLGPQDDVSGGRAFLEGMGGGFLNVARRGARMLTPESMEGGLTRDIEEQEQLDSQMRGMGRAGKFTGEMLATAPIGGAAGAGVRAAGAGVNAAQKAGALSRALSYGAEGSLGSHLTADNSAAAGGILNTVLTPAMNRAGRLVRALGKGMKRTNEADVLLNYGADLTPGQMSPHSMIGRIERTAATSPVIGQGVSEAREAATRAVVPNLSADLAGLPRRAGESMVRSSQRRTGQLNRLYRGADEVGLDEQLRKELKTDQTTRIAAVKEARGLGKRAAERKAGAVRDTVDQAESRVIKARRALEKNKDEELKEALELDLSVAQRKLNYARGQVTDLDPRGPLKAGLERGKAARRAQVPSALKDLESKVTQALQVNRIAKEDPLYNEVLRLGESILQGKTAGAIRKARSELKRLRAAYKYGREGKPSNMAAARVLKEIESWMDDKLALAYKDVPEIAEQVKRADRIVAATKPIEAATEAAMKRGAKEVSGPDLTRALSKSMTRGEFIRGAGRQTRKVAEALTEVRRPLQTGFIERHPFLRMALGTVAVPSAAVLASRPARRIMQGRLGYQRRLGKALERGGKPLRVLTQSLLGLRPGVVPAMMSQEETY